MKIETILFFLTALLINSINSKADKEWVQKAIFIGITRHRAGAFAIEENRYIVLRPDNSGSLSVAYEDWWKYDPRTNLVIGRGFVQTNTYFLNNKTTV